MGGKGEDTMEEKKMDRRVKFDRENTKRVVAKLNIHTDADILAHLETVGNVQGYIKRLIREDIERGKQNA